MGRISSKYFMGRMGCRCDMGLCDVRNMFRIEEEWKREGRS